MTERQTRYAGHAARRGPLHQARGGAGRPVHFTTTAIVQTSENGQQCGLTGTGFTNQGDGFGTFDNEFNSGEDGKLVFS